MKKVICFVILMISSIRSAKEPNDLVGVFVFADVCVGKWADLCSHLGDILLNHISFYTDQTM